MEPSEIMTANALRWSNSTTNKLSSISEYKQLTDLIDDAAAYHKKNYINSGEIQFADTKTQNQARKALDYSIKTLKTQAKVSSRVGDMAVGVSAAIAIRSYMKIGTSDKVIVYTTGNNWPTAVQDFQVDAAGFSSYNSSDLIVTTDNKNFFGISLKKKKTVKANDPTLINKAFTSAFNVSESGNKEVYDQFQVLKENLEKLKINYFADIIIDAVEGNGTFDEKGNKSSTPIIAKTLIDGFDNFKISNKEELFKATQRNKKYFDRTYINTKGWATASEGYQSNKTKDKRSMRYFVNDRLKQRPNPLWEKMTDIIKSGADTLGKHLINIVLKSQLYKELDAKKLDNVAFKFALVTGVGNVTPKKTVTISTAKTVDLKTTLCGLTRIENNFKGPYQVIQNRATADASTEGDGASTAAKVFFKVVKGTSPQINVLDLEVRYGGDFNSQPQFQGGMTKEFKALLDRECSGGPGG